MSDKKAIYNKAEYIRKDFKEFNRKERDKIAEAIELRNPEMILSKVVEDYIYGTTRALDFGDFHGTVDKKKSLWEHAVNKNADLFNYDELMDSHPDNGAPRYMSFRKAAMYKDHQSKSLAHSIGLIFDAYMVKTAYNDMHITTLFGIDKTKEPTIARLLLNYPERVPVSMGCSIKSSSCTVCGHEVKNDMDFCDHLKYSRGGRREGKKVAELLKGIDFYELSVVNTPACSTAYVIDTVAEILPGRLLKIAAETTEGTTIMQVMATVHRMIKEASSPEKKQSLITEFDRLIYKLETITDPIKG